jgi:hypothetical protein
MWLKKLQIAIIEKDADAINALMDAVPEFKNSRDIETAMYLLREAVELLYTLKDETALTMKQLKKNIDFLKSTQPQTKSKLNLRF